MVARTRYRFPLPPPLRRKFTALDRRLDVHVLATAATAADAEAADDDSFELVPPHRPRRLDGPRFYVELPFRVARQLRRFEPDAVVAQSPYEGLGILAGRALAHRKPTVVVEVHGDFRTATRLYGSPARRVLAPIADLAARTALRRLMDKVFDGSPELLLTQFVSDENLSDEELRRLRKLLAGRLREKKP